MCPEDVVIRFGSGRGDVDIEDRDVVASFSDVEACDSNRIGNILNGRCAVEAGWDIVAVALDETTEVS